MSVSNNLFSAEEQHERAWEELAREIALRKNIVQKDLTTVQPQYPGTLTIIGSGIQSLGLIREERLIQEADVVFYCVADPATATWIRTLRRDAYDLYVLYGNHKVRYNRFQEGFENKYQFHLQALFFPFFSSPFH